MIKNSKFNSKRDKVIGLRISEKERDLVKNSDYQYYHFFKAGMDILLNENGALKKRLELMNTLQEIELTITSLENNVDFKKKQISYWKKVRKEVKKRLSKGEK